MHPAHAQLYYTAEPVDNYLDAVLNATLQVCVLLGSGCLSDCLPLALLMGPVFNPAGARG